MATQSKRAVKRAPKRVRGKTRPLEERKAKAETVRAALRARLELRDLVDDITKLREQLKEGK